MRLDAGQAIAQLVAASPPTLGELEEMAALCRRLVERHQVEKEFRGYQL
jgi:hypothetical protein